MEGERQDDAGSAVVVKMRRASSACLFENRVEFFCFDYEENSVTVSVLKYQRFLQSSTADCVIRFQCTFVFATRKTCPTGRRTSSP